MGRVPLLQSGTILLQSGTIIKKWSLTHVLGIGVASAVINFNDGVMGLCRIYQSLDLSFGKYSMKGALDKDMNRIIKMDKTA